MLNRRTMSNVPLLPHIYRDRAPLERLVLHLHALGPRPLAEFLNALATEHDISAEIVAKLREYQRLDAGVVSALGAHRFAPAPLRQIGGGR
jgi:hypothetical protein